MRNFCRIILLSTCGLALFSLGGCAVNPVTGKKELSLISTEGEIALGEQNYTATQQGSGGRYTADAQLVEYVRSVGQRIAAVSDRELPYEFVVINDSSPNAWALPGGKIAVNRGLLVALDNEAELAAVLGHEVVHAAAKHGARSQQRGLLFGALQSVIAAASQDSGDAKYIVDGAALALNLTNKKYGRKAETDSDYYGMKYMHLAGYDTATAVTLQEKFVEFSKGEKSNWLNGLLASHPPSAARVARNRETLAKFPSGGELGEARYQQRLAPLRALQAAYEKADLARELMATDAPSALRTIQSAINQQPREPLFHGIKGHILAQQNRFSAANRAYNLAISRDNQPGYYAHFLGRGLVLQQLGKNQQARQDLELSRQLLPTAAAAYHLGVLALADGERTYAKNLFAQASASKNEIGSASRAAFVNLDLADAPGRYVEVKIKFTERQALLAVKNLTDTPLRNIIIEANVNINGKTTSRNLKIAHLAQNETKTISSDVRYRATDAVEVDTQVLQAQR